MITFVTLGNQEAAQDKLSKLLKLSNNMFTLVLVVGNKELYENVSKEVRSKFEPHQTRRNPPVVLPIPVSIGKKLQSYENWTLNPSDKLNSVIKQSLSNDNPAFVFYRDSGKFNVFDSDHYKKAVGEICELFKLPPLNLDIFKPSK